MQITMDKDELDNYILNICKQSNIEYLKLVLDELLYSLIKTRYNIDNPELTKLIINKNLIFSKLYYELHLYENNIYVYDKNELVIEYKNIDTILEVI